MANLTIVEQVQQRRQGALDRLRGLEKEKIFATPTQKAEIELKISDLRAEIHGLDAQLLISDPFG